MKKCKQCLLQKELIEFYKDCKTKDKHHYICKKCCSIRNKENWKINKDVISMKNKIWRDNNKEWINNYNKQYYQSNKEELVLNVKKYYDEHKKEKSKYNKEYRIVNYKQLREYHNIYDKNRYNNDINFRLTIILRKRLNGAIRYDQKVGSAVDDLGCSIDKLKQHLEINFYKHPLTEEIMTWENYGEWHIDHIIPLSSFDLTDRKQFLKACHYTNLQPLWAEDNLKKGSKL